MSLLSALARVRALTRAGPDASGTFSVCGRAVARVAAAAGGAAVTLLEPDGSELSVGLFEAWGTRRERALLQLTAEARAGGGFTGPARAARPGVRGSAPPGDQPAAGEPEVSQTDVLERAETTDVVEPVLLAGYGELAAATVPLELPQAVKGRGKCWRLGGGDWRFGFIVTAGRPLDEVTHLRRARACGPEGGEATLVWTFAHYSRGHKAAFYRQPG